MKIYIETIGCKLNQFESQALKENFSSKNFFVCDNMEEADCVVINSCSVTGRADLKSERAMKRARRLGKKVIATGCYVTADFEKVRNAGYADVSVKNDKKFSIPEIIEGNGRSAESEFPIVKQFDRTRAFIKVQDGCNKACTYCRIPNARGKSRCLPADDAIGFVRDLVEYGYKEVVLTGVNLSSYNSGNNSLYKLLLKILPIKGDFRLRLSSLQPDEFDPRIVDLLDTGKLANHFHLSLQSGSLSVLRRMGRFYSPAYFAGIVYRIREKDPSCGITTDIIAGFPGETESEFMETVKLVDEIGLSRAHIFSYSPRPGTLSYGMSDIPLKIKKERVRMLEESVLRSAVNFAEKSVIGRKFQVLLETMENGAWTGYTSNYIRIRTKLSGRANSFVEIIPRRIIRKGYQMELTDRE